ncbi:MULTISPECIES: glycine cleavage system aminomethyltransferase GcvT [Planktothricoides]|uniref:Aminomethyltransferase n=2 Tax=Planktothricoides raciborskii TaxID=132608 RepID=A0AAU8JHG0_9CYAN|nr:MULTISPECIES: glycine cleavage system aminomethyltransferase GcvT [Planktothricoides]KOR36424.1 glycine cleavage system protein T [Planktothricoides sp. SR001]MBD2546271.1 glycine cleavage system aminomethyltransferase GcvT [Planktothricoides raciborskii FACHB-1370]MBD2584178.1 glycine cleavage system aminomethyltransferase GcvT [Planktothricoides raciborskii FACHB-1261]
MAKSPEANKTPQTLSRTPLFEVCVELNARMTEFAGWEMPVQYSGITEEHQAVRTTAGMFDISHMGKFILKGKDLIQKLQYLVPSDLSRLQPGEAKYTLLLNPQGGIIDDIIFYYQGQDATGEHRGRMIVNAATLNKDKTWLWENFQGSDVELQDLSPEKALIAVQGPDAVKHLQSLVETDLTAVKYFGHLEAPVCGGLGFFARTGYTGEDGFEVMVDPEVAVTLWRSLLNAGVTPCGLGCRDTLRLEAAMPLYGQDIDDTTTPLEAGLGWVVHLDSKGDFFGREVLEKQKQTGLSRRLVALEMQGRYIARHGYGVKADGETVGEITSGSWSPTLQRAIALAYVHTNLAKSGQELEVEIRGKSYPGVVVKKPFYRSPNRS